MIATMSIAITFFLSFFLNQFVFTHKSFFCNIKRDFQEHNHENRIKWENEKKNSAMHDAKWGTVKKRQRKRGRVKNFHPISLLF